MENTSCEEEDIKIEVPHVTQESNWDCGLACAKMILKYYNIDLDDFNKMAKQCNFGESVWTIDLANLLNSYGIKTCLTTVTLGVDKDYSKKSFYKTRFSVDQNRVDTLFKEASNKGLRVEQRSVPVEEIKEHLKLEQQPLIVLVDWNLLSCLRCSPHVGNHQWTYAHSTSCNCFGQCLGKMGSYQGHFIVVVGYNEKTKVIYFKNPALKNTPLCCCTVDVFDKSRHSHGTDEDILFIYSSQCNHTTSVGSNHTSSVRSSNNTNHLTTDSTRIASSSSVVLS